MNRKLRAYDTTLGTISRILNRSNETGIGEVQISFISPPLSGRVIDLEGAFSETSDRMVLFLSAETIRRRRLSNQTLKRHV